MRKGPGGGGRIFFQFCYPPQPILNDQSLILLNFEDLVLLSPSEIRRELYKLMTGISQGIDRCKVPVVGKNGKLNETIQRSALWSISWEKDMGSPVSNIPRHIALQVENIAKRLPLTLGVILRAMCYTPLLP